MSRELLEEFREERWKLALWTDSEIVLHDMSPLKKLERHKYDVTHLKNNTTKTYSDYAVRQFVLAFRTDEFRFGHIELTVRTWRHWFVLLRLVRSSERKRMENSTNVC